jgi:hypothetical protein
LEDIVLTSVTDHRPLATVTLFAIWVSLARGWVAKLAREIQLRHDMRRLASLDDAMLHDVGLARSGIEDAVRHGRARAECR